MTEIELTSHLLGLEASGAVNELLAEALINPVNEFFKRPGKNIRSQLVELGHRLAHPTEPDELDEKTLQRLMVASSIVEMIHGGSLIVDDIQDGSSVRRNIPCLHLQYGVPLALNAGNWLYFWAMEQVKKLELPREVSSVLMEDIITMMMKAHLGQALDIGTKINQLSQCKVRLTSLTSMELKTGSLLALALRLGTAVAHMERNDDIHQLGLDLGLLLQMQNDVGNFIQTKTGPASKRHEDLYNFRPTWIWAQVSEYPERIYQEFVTSVQLLPDEEKLNRWIEDNEFLKRLESTGNDHRDFVQARWAQLWADSHPESLQKIHGIIKQLESAYVS